MGCDIHFFTERFTKDSITSGPVDISEQRDIKISSILDEQELEPRWVTADVWILEDDEWEIYERFYDGSRSYHLFGVLAGVRTCDYDETICEPRGIPQDASGAYKYMCNKWDGDAHSHSYFTLEELLEVDWKSKDLEWFKDNTIEKMKSIDPDPKKIRAVFFFDN
jgi:hypothetical protein